MTPDERAFLHEREPWGFIIFKRNIDTPAQVRRLTASVRDAVGRDAPVFVDQEGGRVQRLGPPHWPTYPPGAAYGCCYDRNAAEGIRAAYLGARLIAADLAAVGVDVDCLPVADVPVAGAKSLATGLMGKPRRRSLCWGARWPTASLPVGFCRCSSIFPGMAVPRRTATARFPSSRPTAKRSGPPILPHSGRFLICRLG